MKLNQHKKAEDALKNLGNYINEFEDKHKFDEFYKDLSLQELLTKMDDQFSVLDIKQIQNIEKKLSISPPLKFENVILLILSILILDEFKKQRKLSLLSISENVIEDIRISEFIKTTLKLIRRNWSNQIIEKELYYYIPVIEHFVDLDFENEIHFSKFRELDNYLKTIEQNIDDYIFIESFNAIETGNILKLYFLLTKFDPQTIFKNESKFYLEIISKILPNSILMSSESIENMLTEYASEKEIEFWGIENAKVIEHKYKIINNLSELPNNYILSLLKNTIILKYLNKKGMAKILFEAFKILGFEEFQITKKEWIDREIDSDRAYVDNPAWEKHILNSINKIFDIRLLERT